MECLTEYLYIELVLSIIISGLSFILSFIVILIISKEKLYKSYSFRILLYISINDSLRSFIGFFESLVYKNTFACLIYAYLEVYFNLSNLLWAFCLTFTIYQIIVLEEISFEKHHKIWFFVSFVLVGLLEALPFTTQSYGYNQHLCQIIDDDTGEIWRFSLVFFPLFVILTIIMVLFYKIIQKVEILGNMSIKGLVFDRGLVYPLIISIVLIPFFIVRVVQIFYDSCLIQTFVIFMNIFYNFQGFLNGLAFFYSKSVRNALLSNSHGLNATIQSENRSLQISFASEITIN